MTSTAMPPTLKMQSQKTRRRSQKFHKNTTSLPQTLSILLVASLLGFCRARVHEFKLAGEDRPRVALSTFGYNVEGTFNTNISIKTKSKVFTADQFGFTFDMSQTYGASKRIEQEEDTKEAYRQECVLDMGVKAHAVCKRDKCDSEGASSMRRKRSPQGDLDSLGSLGAEYSQVGSNSDFENRVIFNIDIKENDGEPELQITKTQRLYTGLEIRNGRGNPVKFYPVSVDGHQLYVASYPLKWGTSSTGIKDADHNLVNIGLSIKVVNETAAAIYEFNFQDCKDKERREKIEINHNVDIEVNLSEKNKHSYLSAGKIPLPEAYFFLFLLFSGAGFIWFSVLLSATGKVFRLHWLMGSLVVVKSMSLLAHAMDYFYIGKDGHQHGWAVIFYTVYLIRGVLLFFTLALIATGWSFVKCVLSDKEKKIFMVVIPLQVLANVAYIVLESTEESSQNYQTWQEIAIFVDLVCCGAIMFPIVWSIRHLSIATTGDGKGALALRKLRLFRKFYTWTISYIYLTRIGGLLLQMALPYQLEWFGEMVRETTTFIYFMLTGYIFRPGAAKNPYLQLASMDDESRTNLLDGAGMAEGVKRRNVRVIDTDSDDGTDEEDIMDTVALIKAARTPTSMV